MDRLHQFFNDEVARPTIAAAHENSKGKGCKIFKPTKQLFLIPDNKLGKNLRQWRDDASALARPKSATPKP